MEAFKKLPCELILEICDHCPRATVQDLRLISRDFNNFITPYLFLRAKFELQAPPRYTYCSKHGWYQQTRLKGPKDTGQPCNGKKNVPNSIRLVKKLAMGDITHKTCPFFDSPEWKNMRQENFKTNTANPIFENMRSLLNDATTMDVVSRHARTLTLSLKGIDFFTVVGGERGDVRHLWWDPEVQIDTWMGQQLEAVLRPLLDALPKVRVVCLDIDYPHWEYPLRMASILGQLCNSLDPLLELDVQALVANQRYSLGENFRY